MRARNAIIGTMAFLLAGPVWAQTRPATEAPTKVAVINIQTAIAATEEGKQAAQQLQTRFAPRLTELTDLSKRISDIQQRAQDGQTTLSDAEKNNLAQQYQLLTRQYQRKQQELQGDEQDAQSDVYDTLGPKMLRLVDQYAGQHGFSLVLDTSSQSTPVLYFSNAIDITSAIVKLYDQTYPVAKNAPAPKPKK